MPTFPFRQHRSRNTGARRIVHESRGNRRRLLLEPLEQRHLLAAGSLLYGAIDDAFASPTNAGLTMALDLDLGRQMPLHAQVPITSEGVSGAAFLPDGQLLTATSDGPGSASALVRVNPLTGEEISRLAITASGSPISIADLAAQPGNNATIYGVRSADDGGGGAGQIYTIDVTSGAASLVGRPNSPGDVDGGLAFDPNGTLYYTSRSAAGGAVLHTLDVTTAAILTTVSLSGSQGYNTGLGFWAERNVLVGTGATNGDLVTINSTTGARTAITLEAPARGILGDVDFQPTSPMVQHVHRADFEGSTDGYTVDNTGGSFPGLWHRSLGRRMDGLLNHSVTHAFYYGAFEGPRGGGRYDVYPGDHQGVLISPLIELPQNGTSILSFSYVLNTRVPLNVDFVDVLIDTGDGSPALIKSRQDGSLPQTTREKWLTSTADISAFNGQEIRVLFRFDTGDVPTIDPEGWYVDDVQISNFSSMGSVHGFKYNDVADNGQYDPGDPLMAGVTIELTEKTDLNNNGTLDTFSTVTDAQGRYNFVNLVPGGYVLSEVPPPTALPGTPFSLMVSVADGEELVAVAGEIEHAPGQYETVVPELAIGNSLYGSIHGLKLDATSGLPVEGMPIVLLGDSDGDGSQDRLDVLTDADGRYWFEGLYPGTYTVTETNTGTLAAPPLSVMISLKSGEEAVAATGESTIMGPLGIGQFESEPNPNLILRNLFLGSIHGLKLDADSGLPIEGMPIVLLGDINGDGSQDQLEVLTDADGRYWFEDLYPGTYTITETDTGTLATPPLSVMITIQSGEEAVAVAGESTIMGPLGIGQFESEPNPELTLENLFLGSIHGMKVDVTSGLPVQGMPIVLLGDVDGNGTQDELTTITDADGRYWFEDLYPGTYIVTETDPGTLATAPLSVEITIVSGEEAVAVAGESTIMGPLGVGQFESAPNDELILRNEFFGSIHGYKFNDLNGNGVDDGEPRLSGVTITLTGEDGVPHSVVTGSNGAYAFEDLLAGMYTVAETPPLGSVPTTPTSIVVVIASGEELVAVLGEVELGVGQFETLNAGLAFGNQLTPQTLQFITPMSLYRLAGPDEPGLSNNPSTPPAGSATVSGYLWHDVDQDGVWDAGEPGRSGWTIFIDANDNGSFDPGERFAVTGKSATVAGTANNGSGLVRVATAAPHGFVTGGTVTIAGVQGTGGANGIWTVTVIDATHFDLQDSSFVNAYTGGGTASTVDDGSYTISGLAAGTYMVVQDTGRLSDGTFRIETFPTDMSTLPPGVTVMPGTHSYTVELAANEMLAGAALATEAPNFGSFDYSPFVRPADNEPGQYFDRLAGDSQRQAALLAALSGASARPWQTFHVTNATADAFEITAVNKVIHATPGISAADAAQFVKIYLLDGGQAVEPTFPIVVAAGESVEFFAFYDPAIRSADGATVLAQYPDWYNDPDTAEDESTRPPHMFNRDDHLEIVTEYTQSGQDGPMFQVNLVGASTYDSDITYDGAVDRADVERLFLFLDNAWPTKDGVPGSAFDPTSDVNARSTNGAQKQLGTTGSLPSWSIDGQPPREIGLGDFGPINVEWTIPASTGGAEAVGRARAPFLDLDTDNSSGTLGVDFRVDKYTPGTSVAIADTDARFANSVERLLASMTVTLGSPLAGDMLTVDLTGSRIVSSFDGTVLTLSGPMSAISNITNDGGQIRVTTSAANSLTEGDRVVISGVVGTTEANGVWAIDVISPTEFVLESSTFTNAYVSGGSATALLPVDDYNALLAQIHFESSNTSQRTVEILFQAFGFEQVAGMLADGFTQLEGNIAVTTLAVVAAISESAAIATAPETVEAVEASAKVAYLADPAPTDVRPPSATPATASPTPVQAEENRASGPAAVAPAISSPAVSSDARVEASASGTVAVSEDDVPTAESAEQVTTRAETPSRTSLQRDAALATLNPIALLAAESDETVDAAIGFMPSPGRAASQTEGEPAMPATEPIMLGESPGRSAGDDSDSSESIDAVFAEIGRAAGDMLLFG